MKANEFAILTRAVEEGIEAGWHRAHKHTDTPTDEAMKHALHDAVMNEICEVFHFEPIKEDGE